MTADDQAGIRLHGWFRPPVVAAAVMVLAAGFGQFGAVAALGDVAEAFGTPRPGETIAEQAGLSGTTLGVGLALIRLASILSLPLAGAADRLGRRSTLASFAVIGLLVTASASLSPNYWWFVALFAASRPFLTATNTVAQVNAAEHTATPDRIKALALVAAAYGVGSGLIAVTRGLASEAVGFRGVFALALVALVLVLLVARWLEEPDRYRAVEAARDKPRPVLGAVGARHRRRLATVAGLVFAVAVITGPANSFVFVYAENVVGLSATATAAMVVTAGVAGLGGLLLGRWAADTLGRRVTGGVAMVLVGAAGIFTYSGSAAAAVAGYLGAVAAGSAFAPAMAAIAAEIFPTEVRAAVGGWTVTAGVVGAVAGLMAFGVLADTHEDFGVAAAALFLPAAAVALLFRYLPETKGRELEDWEGD